jgi:hypothetical protein
VEVDPSLVGERVLVASLGSPSSGAYADLIVCQQHSVCFAITLTKGPLHGFPNT